MKPVIRARKKRDENTLGNTLTASVKEKVFHFVVRIFCLVTNIKSIPFQPLSLEEVRQDCSERVGAQLVTDSN